MKSGRNMKKPPLGEHVKDVKAISPKAHGRGNCVTCGKDQSETVHSGHEYDHSPQSHQHT